MPTFILCPNCHALLIPVMAYPSVYWGVGGMLGDLHSSPRPSFFRHSTQPHPLTFCQNFSLDALCQSA